MHQCSVIPQLMSCQVYYPETLQRVCVLINTLLDFSFFVLRQAAPCVSCVPTWLSTVSSSSDNQRMKRQQPPKENRYHYFCLLHPPTAHSQCHPSSSLLILSMCNPSPSPIFPPISSLLSLCFPPIASGSHAAVVCFLLGYMWAEDKPPQRAGLSDSLLNASASLFHTAWQRSHCGESKKEKKVFEVVFGFFAQKCFKKTIRNL